MIRIGNHLDRPLLSDRTRRRLASIGVTIISFEVDDRMVLPGPARAVERAIIESSVFTKAVGPWLPAMRKYVGQVCEVLPGLRLVSLPTRCKWLVDDRIVQPVVAAILLGREFLGSASMASIARERGEDAQAMLAQVDHEALVDDTEAERLARMIVWMQIDGVEADRHCEELGQLSQELGACYEELSLLYRLTTNMTVDRPCDQFIDEACEELQQVVGHRWMALLLHEDQTRLGELAGRLFTAGEIGCEPRTLRLIAGRLMRRYDAATEPVVVEDVATLELQALSRLAQQLLVVPLVREDRTLGILFGGDKIDGESITSADAKLCHALTNSLTIFLENTMLFEDVQTMFMGTLHALTTSIDAKDRYTRGHSERVAVMARELARAAGLGEQEIERIYLCGLIHDLGKIGIPEAVLTKPGQLTTEEFEVIKRHPEIGARIIADVKPMQDLIPGVLYHHERFAGGGYPTGLAGEEIPLMARIITLADAYDAMSSDRAYRHPKQHLQALTEIQQCAGSQFDPVLAEQFVRLDFTLYFELIREHRIEGAMRSKTG